MDPTTGQSGAMIGSAGDVLRLIREGRAATRTDLATLTGLGRSAIAQRVDALIERKLVYEVGGGLSTGGRPPTMLAFNAAAGVVLAADLGATHCRLEVSDLAGSQLASASRDLRIDAGPDHVLGWVADRFDELLDQAGRSRADVRGIGIGVPGPVEFASGTPVNPPIMPGWHGVSIPDRLSDRFPVPVMVDNDVNIMALGEHYTNWREVRHLVFVKVGTGIGSGIIAAGRVHRGAQGAAGDIGHIRVSGYDDVVCKCGQTACVEAVAGGRALAARLTELGYPAKDSRDVVALVRGGNPDATRLVRHSGRLIGEILASVVNFFNPAAIVLGGDIAQAHEELLAGIREIVYQRSLPLATRHLRIAHSELGDRVGTRGAVVMVIERVLSPEAIESEAIDGHRVAGTSRSEPSPL